MTGISSKCLYVADQSKDRESTYALKCKRAVVLKLKPFDDCHVLLPSWESMLLLLLLRASSRAKENVR